MRAVDFVLTVLLSSLWQAPVLAFIAWASLRIVRKSTASTRYAVWLFALIAVTVGPIVTGAYLTVRDTGSPPVTQPVSAPAVTQPRVQQRQTTAASHSQPAVTSNAGSGVVESAPVAPRISRARLTPSPQIANVLGGLWLLVTLALLAKLAIDFFALERLKRDALPLPVEYRDALQGWSQVSEFRDVRLCVSDKIEVPVAVGLFDAMILLPAHLVESLSPHEIDQIALHELAHLRRADDWSNGFQRVVITLYFFNPVVRWISHQLDLEREVACDDHVVSATQSVRPYAQCLAKMAEVTAWPHTALAAPGVFNTRKSISIRIERLLKSGRNARVSVSYPVLSATTLGALVVVFVALTAGPIIAASTPCPPVAPVHTASKQRARHAAVAPRVKLQSKIVKVAVAPYTTLPTPVTVAEAVVAKTQTTAAAPKKSHAKQAPRPMRTLRPLSTPRPYIAHGPAILPGSGIIRCNGCSFGSVNWSGRDLRGIVLHGANLADANLTNADLRDADLSGSNLANVHLQGAKLAGTRLAGVNFQGVNLQDVDLSQADISGANIDVKSLDKATLRMMLTKCKGCNFGDADFRNMDLRGMTITGANFANTDFRGADLRGTTFNGANFAGTKFAGANVEQAHFVGCNFTDADFRGVDVNRAEFVGSNMSGIII